MKSSTTTPKTVLFVDDEPAVLDGLKKALRPFRHTWAVETAVGGAAAIARIHAGPVDAVVTDARMPGVDGEAVLRAVVAHAPATIRVVLSGEVGHGKGPALATLAHQFLPKPCAASAVLAAVEGQIAVVERLASPALRTLLAQLGTLPIPPRTYMKMSALLEDPRAPLDTIVAVIEESPLVAASVLRLVGSAFFGLPRKVATLRDAVASLGLEAVRRAVLMAEVFAAPDPLGIVDALQEAAQRRARIARLLAQGPATTLAVEGALLADVGAYVLALRLPAYAPVWREAAGGEVSLSDLEREAFGATHADVGAALLALWGLPVVLQTAVARHHEIAGGDRAGAVRDAQTIVALACAVTTLEELDPVATTPAVEARATTLRHDLARLCTSLGVDAALCIPSAPSALPSSSIAPADRTSTVHRGSP